MIENINKSEFFKKGDVVILATEFDCGYARDYHTTDHTFIVNSNNKKKGLYLKPENGGAMFKAKEKDYKFVPFVLERKVLFEKCTDGNNIWYNHNYMFSGATYCNDFILEEDKNIRNYNDFKYYNQAKIYSAFNVPRERFGR